MEEFTNTGLFCKAIVSSGSRKSCANIGRNFKLNYLAEKRCVSNETDCYSLGPVGPKMRPDGTLPVSGMTFKLRPEPERQARQASAPPTSGGSETPSLAELDAANLAAAPAAVARGRGFQPQTAFESRRPSGLRLTLNPTGVGKGGQSFDEIQRSMRADNLSFWRREAKAFLVV